MGWHSIDLLSAMQHSILLLFLSNSLYVLAFIDPNQSTNQANDKSLPPRIQIRAILIRCPQHIIPDNSLSGRSKPRDDKVISVLRTDDILGFAGFDKDELLMHSEVKNCKRKMIITMMINNYGRTITEEEFVLVDHVYDPDLHKRSRLLNPFVFKVKQDVVLQLYGMRYIQSVNAKAREEVINKEMRNFTGCDTSSPHATCGLMYHNKRVVPFSEGFCCSCDSYVNLQRQPSHSILRPHSSFSKPKKKVCLDDNNDLDENYYKERFKRDFEIKQKNPGKRSNIENLRSKYLSKDFDFVKNGFYTPQIVRNRDHLSDIGRFTNLGEVSSWNNKNIFSDVVEKGNRIPWNNDNPDPIPVSEAVENDRSKKKKRSVDDASMQGLSPEHFGGLRVMDEKPYWLKPKDWSSLQALKLRVKGAKPISPKNRNCYKPAHKYFKLPEETPTLELGRGFQMSDYRPNWKAKSLSSPWDVKPYKCPPNNKTFEILRVLGKLHEEQGDSDSSVDFVENFDNVLKNIKAKLIRDTSGNHQPMLKSNDRLSSNDSLTNDELRCDGDWNELQTLMLELALEDETFFNSLLEDETSNYQYGPDKSDRKEKFVRLKRQLNDWSHKNYELDLSSRVDERPNLNGHPPSLSQIHHGKSPNSDIFYLNPPNNIDKAGPVASNINLHSLDASMNGPYELDESQNFDFQLEKEKNNTLNPDLDSMSRDRNALGLISNSQVDRSKMDENNEQKRHPQNNNYDQRSNLGYDKMGNSTRLGNLIDGSITMDNPNLEKTDLNNLELERPSGSSANHPNPPLNYSNFAPAYIDGLKHTPSSSNSLQSNSIEELPNSIPSLSNGAYPINPIVPGNGDHLRISEASAPDKVMYSGIVDKAFQNKKIPSHSEVDRKSRDEIGVASYNFNAQPIGEHPLEPSQISVLQKLSRSNVDLVRLKERDNIQGQFQSSMTDEQKNYENIESDILNKYGDLANSKKDETQNSVEMVSVSNKYEEFEPLFLDNRDSNPHSISNQNFDKHSLNSEILFDEDPNTDVSNVINLRGSNWPKSNRTLKTYRVYKQEMGTPFEINTSNLSHEIDYNMIKSNGESSYKKSPYLRIPSEIGNPFILKASEVQNVMQNAVNNAHTKKTPQLMYQDASMSTGSNSTPLFISGNVGNIYGQKGKLIFIPDETGDTYSLKQKAEIGDVNRKFMGDFKQYGGNSRHIYYNDRPSHMNVPNSTKFETDSVYRNQYSDLTHSRNKKISPSSTFLNNPLEDMQSSLLGVDASLDGEPERSRRYGGEHTNILERDVNFEDKASHSGSRATSHISNPEDDQPQSRRVSRSENISTSKDSHVDIDVPSGVSNDALNNSSAIPFEITDAVDNQESIDEDEFKKRDTAEEQCKKKGRKMKRQVSSNGNQVRGGQNCIDRYSPPKVDPITYHESAHCLRFSELWYSVHTLKRPSIDHSMNLQLYEKYNFKQSTHWEELTRGIVSDLGTGNRHIGDELSTLSFTYIPLTDLTSGEFCLDEHKATLLVPEQLPPKLASKFPQVNGNPNEYLLVQSDDISLEGDECNKVGTSFEGFVTQADRCSQPRGTCLKNQPLDMWNHDMAAKEEGRPGKFFLENYAVVAEQPLLVNQSSQEQSLALEYYNQFSTVIEIEVRSDLNAIVRTGESGQISEIYVDGSCHSSTRITVIVTNVGLASSAYYPKLANCPVELPAVWTTNVGPLTMIAPQHRHIFHMTMFGELPIDRFHCSVELMNDRKELVATRRVRIQKHDRCLCVWHCLCACTASTSGFNCEVMSKTHYHAAGFQGSLPVVKYHPEIKPEKILKLLIPFAIVTFFKLFLGFLKAVVGLCFPVVGAYGLWAIRKSKSENLEAYKEDELKDYAVEHDSSGYAIHPIKQTRNIKLYNKCAEFLINVFFPFLLLWASAKYIACCCFKGEDEDYKSDEDSLLSSESDTESNDLEDESVVVNSVIEEKRRCVEDVKGYNVEVSNNKCLIMVEKPQEKK